MGGDGPSCPRGPLPVLGEAQPTPVFRPVSWAAGAAPILPHPCLKALEARPKVGSPGLACISGRGLPARLSTGWRRERINHFPGA